MRVLTRAGVLAAGIAVILVASPAHANMNDNTVGSPGRGVKGTCAWLQNLPGDSFNEIRVALAYQVTATGAAYATNGVCEVRDLNGGTGSRSYGSISAFGIGPYAAGAGYVDVPRDIVAPVVCNIPQALYTDGTEGNPTNIRKCDPL